LRNPKPRNELRQTSLWIDDCRQNLAICGDARQKIWCKYTFDATKKEDLLKIIAVLRKFKVILETTLLD
jgi:hypothetical protein